MHAPIQFLREISLTIWALCSLKSPDRFVFSAAHVRQRWAPKIDAGAAAIVDACADGAGQRCHSDTATRGATRRRSPAHV